MDRWDWLVVAIGGVVALVMAALLTEDEFVSACSNALRMPRLSAPRLCIGQPLIVTLE
jgi:hypothetical protein